MLLKAWGKNPKVCVCVHLSVPQLAFFPPYPSADGYEHNFSYITVDFLF